MGFRFDTSKEAMEKDFERASKVPGGRLAFLNRFPEAIRWIDDPSPMEQLVALGAITLKGFNMPKYLRIDLIAIMGKLDDEIAYQIVSSTNDSFPGLAQYSEKIQRRAIERSPQRIKSLDNPSEKVRMMCAQHRYGALELMSHLQLSDRVLMRAIQTDGANIRHIQNPSQAMMEKAVRKNGENIQHIKNPPADIIELAIRKSGMAIQFISNQTPELQRLAVSRCAQAVTVIENPLDELQIAAVKKSPTIVRLIKQPCEEAMWEALKAKPKLIKDMKYATPEMKSYVALIT